jgi:hypothetical protein
MTRDSPVVPSCCIPFEHRDQLPEKAMHVVVDFVAVHGRGHGLAYQLNRRFAFSKRMKKGVVIFEQDTFAVYYLEDIGGDVAPDLARWQGQILSVDEIDDDLQGICAKRSPCSQDSARSAAHFHASGTNR